MTNKDNSIDGTSETHAKALAKERSEVKGREREHLTKVGIGNDDNKDDNDENYDENYDNGAAASDYEVAGGGADVTGGSNVVRDRDEYGFGGHGNGEGNNDDDHVGDSVF